MNMPRLISGAALFLSLTVGASDFSTYLDGPNDRLHENIYGQPTGRSYSDPFSLDIDTRPLYEQYRDRSRRSIHPRYPDSIDGRIMDFKDRYSR